MTGGVAMQVAIMNPSSLRCFQFFDCRLIVFHLLSVFLPYSVGKIFLQESEYLAINGIKPGVGLAILIT